MPSDADVLPPLGAAVRQGGLAALGLPPSVDGFMTTRLGGVGVGAFQGLNLRPPTLQRGLAPADQDDPARLQENHRRLGLALPEGVRPVWLHQVHGVAVHRARTADGPQDLLGGTLPQADAVVTTERGLACAVQVADCLPVLLAAQDGSAVGAAHAGWRGLAGGVLEATVASLCEAAGVPAAGLTAWLGACIGPQRFEVGEEVRAAFGPRAAHRFTPGAAPGKWWCDLPGLAHDRLAAAGVAVVGGGGWCTVSEPSRFFSFRRDRCTGRHAALVWRR